jgi:hypothetical protein
LVDGQSPGYIGAPVAKENRPNHLFYKLQTVLHILQSSGKSRAARMDRTPFCHSTVPPHDDADA